MSNAKRARAVRRFDHHRPHLARRRHQAKGPAGAYLREHGVPVTEFNSYGARRGNHEVMMRGTFANIRIKNHMVKNDPGVEGGITLTRRRAGCDLRRGDGIHHGEDAAGDLRRQGIRHRLLTRLGRQGHDACLASAPSSPRASSASTAPT
jgi:hypothetical protein